MYRRRRSSDSNSVLLLEQQQQQIIAEEQRQRQMVERDEMTAVTGEMTTTGASNISSSSSEDDKSVNSTGSKSSSSSSSPNTYPPTPYHNSNNDNDNRTTSPHPTQHQQGQQPQEQQQQQQEQQHQQYWSGDDQSAQSVRSTSTYSQSPSPFTTMPTSDPLALSIGGSMLQRVDYQHQNQQPQYYQQHHQQLQQQNQQQKKLSSVRPNEQTPQQRHQRTRSGGSMDMRLRGSNNSSSAMNAGHRSSGTSFNSFRGNGNSSSLRSSTSSGGSTNMRSLRDSGRPHNPTINIRTCGGGRSRSRSPKKSMPSRTSNKRSNRSSSSSSSRDKQNYNNMRSSTSNRHPRNNNHHVTPGVQFHGNNNNDMYENEGTFRMDPNQGITLNLRNRSNGETIRYIMQTMQGMQPGMQHGMQPGMHHGMQQGMHYGMQPGMHHGMQQGMHYGMQQGMHHGMQQGMHHGMQQGMHHGMQQGMHHGMQTMNGMPMVHGMTIFEESEESGSMSGSTTNSIGKASSAFDATSTTVKEGKMEEERAKEETRTLTREPNNQYNIRDTMMHRDVSAMENRKVEAFGDEDRFVDEVQMNTHPSGGRHSLKSRYIHSSEVSVQESVAKEVPFPQIRAPRRNSLKSMMSELSLGDLGEVKKEAGEALGGNISRMALIKPEEIAKSAPNDPHSGLEYPPLYFLIHRVPFLLNLVKWFIRFRWRVSYPLQRRVPLSRILRKANIFCTIGELFIILPLFVTLIICTIYSFVYPSVSISGHAARTPLILAFATASHNSLLTLLLGLPFERAVFYHKVLARLAFMNGLMHTFVAFFYPADAMENEILPEVKLRELDYDESSSTLYSYMGNDPNFGRFMFANSINIGGTGIIGFMTLMVITALPWVRRKVFELFYFVHISCCFAMIACAFFHTGILIPLLGSVTWGLDLFIRKIYMALFRYPRKASVRIISESVVEICFPKTASFHYNPGQYVFLAIPEISYFEWHPFSISSSPQQKIVTFHIRKAGRWTHELYKLADYKSEIDIMFEGPYGAVGVDISSPDRYKMAMLFSGGIGVTPMQALCNHIMYEHSSGKRNMKKLSFIWIERDPIVLQKVDVVRRETQNKSGYSIHKGDGGGENDEENNGWKPGGSVALRQSHRQSYVGGDEPQGLASTLLSLVPASDISDRVLERQYPHDELNTGKDEEDIEDDNYTIASVFRSIRSMVGGSYINHDIRTDNGTTPLVSNEKDNSSTKESIDDIEEQQQEEEDDDEEEDDYNPMNEYDNNTLCQSFLDDAYNTNNIDKDLSDDGVNKGSQPAEEPLDLQVYLTARKEVNPAIENLPFVHRGRPDIKELFRKTRDEAIEKGECRVAVCVCAPKIIVDMCHTACVKYSDRKVCFDFHYEVFG